MRDVGASVDLGRRNTLALPSIAAHAVRASSVDDVRAAVDLCHRQGWPLTILGGGSNVVLRDRIPGCVVLPELEWIQREDGPDGVRVRAGAGVRWHELVRYCIGQGVCGLENLALIPGSVGGAPIQNIGAYGVEIESRLAFLTAVSCRDGSLRRFNRADCAFGYRDSVFKRDAADRFLIVEVCLELQRTFVPTAGYPDVRDELARLSGPVSAARLAEAVIRVRRRKLPDPRRVPNAGSFFKNPVVSRAQYDALQGRIGPIPSFPAADGVKVPAARLIDMRGWKGRRLGRAGVWSRQALVLVNLGGARAVDMLQLADAITDDVGDHFGIALELEPRVIGTDDAA